ncbi:hypothetical protein UFOVP653_30 [uncultured Caudovirales phage]|uniref:Uncharacterized protein n=1 Tax=uncultured Caudovirales phage TaxID=2100421 RepID=A0A6J5NCA2_9CAUD|nr:hypothetical protein UFOVP653_30 [uncultured Caudovirales phage]
MTTVKALISGQSIARAVERSVHREIIRKVLVKAEDYILENKLIHAGAALALADRLKADLHGDKGTLGDNGGQMSPSNEGKK